MQLVHVWLMHSLQLGFSAFLYQILLFGAVYYNSTNSEKYSES